MLKDYRCSECNKLFFKANIKDGKIEIKCKNCKRINTIITAMGKDHTEIE